MDIVCYCPAEYTYHAFIIYSQGDSDWVSRKLLPLLEEKHHLKCCIHYRDFAPGKPFQDSMAESVYKSYKIIAVLSSNFLKSNYCSYELNIAKYRLLNRGDDCLVIIKIDNEDCRKLPRELRKRNFIDYSNPLEKPLWEHKLLTFLNVPNDSSNRGVREEKQNYDDIDQCIDSSNAFSISMGSSRNEGDELNCATNMVHIDNKTPPHPFIRSHSQPDGSPDEEWETVL